MSIFIFYVCVCVCVFNDLGEKRDYLTSNEWISNEVCSLSLSLSLSLLSTLSLVKQSNVISNLTEVEKREIKF